MKARLSVNAVTTFSTIESFFSRNARVTPKPRPGKETFASNRSKSREKPLFMSPRLKTGSQTTASIRPLLLGDPETEGAAAERRFPNSYSGRQSRSQHHARQSK